MLKPQNLGAEGKTKADTSTAPANGEAQLIILVEAKSCTYFACQFASSWFDPSLIPSFRPCMYLLFVVCFRLLNLHQMTFVNPSPSESMQRNQAGRKTGKPAPTNQRQTETHKTHKPKNNHTTKWMEKRMDFAKKNKPTRTKPTKQTQTNPSFLALSNFSIPDLTSIVGFPFNACGL